MLKKCLGNCVENWCWKKCLGNCLMSENWCWKESLGSCVENWYWKTVLGTAWKTDVGKSAWGTACKTNARKSAWGTVWKTDVGKGAWGTVWKTDVGKSDWGTAWKTNAGKSDWGTVWKTAEKVTEKVLFQGHNVTSLKLKRRQCRLQLGTAMNLVLHICCGLKYDSSSNIHHRQLIKFLPQPAAACLPFPIPLKLSHVFSHFDELSRFVCFDVCCEMSLFTRFDTFWWNVAIYALWRMSAKCRDLRTLPGTKFRLPGTFNYSAPLLG